MVQSNLSSSSRCLDSLLGSVRMTRIRRADVEAEQSRCASLRCRCVNSFTSVPFCTPPLIPVVYGTYTPLSTSSPSQPHITQAVFRENEAVGDAVDVVLKHKAVGGVGYDKLVAKKGGSGKDWERGMCVTSQCCVLWCLHSAHSLVPGTLYYPTNPSPPSPFRSVLGNWVDCLGQK